MPNAEGSQPGYEESSTGIVPGAEGRTRSTPPPADTIVSNGINAAAKPQSALASRAARIRTKMRIVPRDSAGCDVSAVHSAARVVDARDAGARRRVVAFGPELPGFGSWEWIGRDLADALASRFETLTYRVEPPECDVLVLVKWRPQLDVLQRVAARSAIVYCPVDLYGSAADIDADWRVLRLCRRIVVHCPELARYFRSYAPVELLDHHIKYATPLRSSFVEYGPILWTGVWLNLPPLVDWVNHLVATINPLGFRSTTVYSSASRPVASVNRRNSVSTKYNV